jgi:glycopeptide antibiotics resistance protein
MKKQSLRGWVQLHWLHIKAVEGSIPMNQPQGAEAQKPVEQRSIRMEAAKERRLERLAWAVFAVYFFVLIRIVLFKDVPLYAILAEDSGRMRSFNGMPFATLAMLWNGSGLLRFLENAVGNVLLFVPLGLLIPLLLKRGGKQTLFVGVAVSLCFEIVQYIGAYGASDIDDVLLNGLGTLLGIKLLTWLRNRKGSKGSKGSRGKQLAAALALIVPAGLLSLALLFVTHTDLFQLAPKIVTVQQGDLVEEWEREQATARGAATIVSGSEVGGKWEVLLQPPDVGLYTGETLEKEQRRFTLDAATQIVVEQTTLTFLFDMLTREDVRYEPVVFADFISTWSKEWKSGPVTIWSGDGRHADRLLIHLVSY